MNSLSSPFLSFVDRAGRRHSTTLPGLFAAEMRDEIDDFPPSGRTSGPRCMLFWRSSARWQLLAVRHSTLPDKEDDWAAALRSLRRDILPTSPGCSSSKM